MIQLLKKIFICLSVFLLFFSITPVAIAEEEAAEEDRPTAKLSLGFYSDYIWRGYALGHDSLVIFPTTTISYKGFSMNMWGDMDTNYEGTGEKEWWETDWVWTYSNNFDILNYTLGYIYYDTDAGNTQELYLTLGLSTLLNPTISVYRDIELGEAYYWNFAVSQNIPFPVKTSLTEDWSFDVGGWVSYMHRPGNYGLTNYEAMHDGNVWAALNIPINKYMTLVPSMNYSFPLSDHAKDEIRGGSVTGQTGDAEFIYGGAAINIAF